MRVRIAPGCLVPAAAWAALTPLQRHAQRVWESAIRAHPGTVYSYFAAAALHGIDILGAWPDRIDVSVTSAAGGRSTGIIRRHTRDMSRVQWMPWGEHFVTTPAQTAVDLASVLPFAQGVVVADQALWVRRPGGPLVTRAELRDRVEDTLDRRRARAGRAVSFAQPAADSVRESESRVLIDALGFPEPQLQQRFDLPSGRVVYTDFGWPGFDHAAEFDGVGKYVDPSILRGRTPAQALLEEKDRGDELRRVVGRLSRWRTPALAEPRRLYEILRADGLPLARAQRVIA